MKPTKVFGIGFHKTATTSLARALTHLGYRVTGPNGVYNPNIASDVYTMAYDLVERFDAFQDNPWPVIYRELDERYPGSKFVLTIRPAEQWIASIVDHFGEDDTPMRRWIYGTGRPKGNENIYLARYQRHNQEVLSYFRDRPQQLLVMDITAGEGWEKLCPFLSESTPGVPFPCANTASERVKSHKKERSYLWRTYAKGKRHLKQLLKPGTLLVRSRSE